MTQITHAIFDNDGVNIQSETLAMRIMEEMGYALVMRYDRHAPLEPEHIYNTYAGTSTDAIVRKLIDTYHLPEDSIRQDYEVPEGEDAAVFIADQITIETINRFAKELKGIPGITQALEGVRDMLGAENMALATTSRADRMKVSLDNATDHETGENARLSEFFPEGERCRSGYGHPNKYDEAFEALGWNPATTVVVEDSLSGVTKAKAHHDDVRVIGTAAADFFPDKPAHAAALLNAGASMVITAMRDLPNAMRWLSTGLDPAAKPDFQEHVYVPTQESPAAKLKARP